MNAIASQQQYEQAIIKCGVGIYIIESAATALGHAPDIVNVNITRLCNLLADNIKLPRASVMEDAREAHDRIPMYYIHELHCTGMIDEMAQELFRLKIIFPY